MLIMGQRLWQVLFDRARYAALRDRAQQAWERYTRGTAVGQVRFGSLRRLHPIGEVFGVKRGQSVDRCIDRYYITAFLARYAADIHGHVLEIADNTYTRRFGGGHVQCADVLHAVSGNPAATIVADLTSATNVPSERFDCIILTQTLQYIYDLRAALRTVHRLLKPGGVVLATVPGISQTSRYDAEQWGEFWRFTTLSAQRLFGEAFPAHGMVIQGHGNVLVALAFLHGLLSEELRQEELDYHDPDYELLITIRAQKPPAEPEIAS
jgi:SAM-dependent methyltransferase